MSKHETSDRMQRFLDGIAYLCLMLLLLWLWSEVKELESKGAYLEHRFNIFIGGQVATEPHIVKDSPNTTPTKVTFGEKE